MGVAAAVGLLGLAGLTSPATRALATPPPASGASAGRVLSTAIARFASADPSLFAPDGSARSGGQWIRPTLRAADYGHDEYGPSVSTSLFGAPSRMEVELFNEEHNLQVSVPGESRLSTGSAVFSLPSDLASNASRLQGIAGNAGAAFVVAGVQRDTDLLIRALPFGVGVYVLFSSADAPERIWLETYTACPPTGFELYRRLAPGSFSFEEQLTSEDEEDECEPYSHAPVATIRPPSPTNTAAALQSERSLLGIADRQAHRDRSIAALVVRAYQARGDDGHVVPTEMAWRGDEGPVIRVHLGARGTRFPVLMRFDVITPP